LNIKVFCCKMIMPSIYGEIFDLIYIFFHLQNDDNVIITKPFCEKRFHYRIECISFE